MLFKKCEHLWLLKLSRPTLILLNLKNISTVILFRLQIFQPSLIYLRFELLKSVRRIHITLYYDQSIQFRTENATLDHMDNNYRTNPIFPEDSSRAVKVERVKTGMSAVGNICCGRLGHHYTTAGSPLSLLAVSNSVYCLPRKRKPTRLYSSFVQRSTFSA